MGSIKKRYEELKKKHPLPDYTELNSEFEISSIEHEEFLLGDIRRKMDEKTEVFVKILNAILQPETNIAELMECKEFGSSEKEDIFRLYRKLMLIHGAALVAGIEGGEKENAGFISETFKEWGPIKKQMAGIVRKMREAWKKEAPIKEELGYLG